jgi:hypothetical protein
MRSVIYNPLPHLPPRIPNWKSPPPDFGGKILDKPDCKPIQLRAVISRPARLRTRTGTGDTTVSNWVAQSAASFKASIRRLEPRGPKV